MTEAERQQALTLLKSPDLFDRILNGFDTYGLVGDRTNKLTGYLAALSRKLDKPLTVFTESAAINPLILDSRVFIRAIFHARFHFFICFSRLIAASILSCSS